MELLRKYNTATTVYFPLVDFGAQDFESTPVTFASGDTQISKDGGAFANTGSNPSHEGNGVYSLALTATEMEAGLIQITLIDQTAPKTWEDQAILLQTYGNASASLVFDLSQAIPVVNTTQIEGSDATDQINAACDTALADYDAPTKAELDSGFSALNNLSSADVTAAVPTTAEIEAALINEGDGQQLIDAIVNVINTSLDIPSLELAAIASAVRTELSTELGRIDTAVSTRGTATDLTAVKTKTDQLTFGVTNTLNANITYVNEVEVDGAGTSGDPWGAV